MIAQLVKSLSYMHRDMSPTPKDHVEKKAGVKCTCVTPSQGQGQRSVLPWSWPSLLGTLQAIKRANLKSRVEIRRLK